MTRPVLLACLLLLACSLGFTAWLLAGADVSAFEEPGSPGTWAGEPPLPPGTRVAEAALAEAQASSERSAVPIETGSSYDVLVQDKAGRPIARAEVLRNEAEHRDTREPVFTDEDGRCSLSGLGDSARFHVRAEGFCHATQGTAELTVVLVRAGRVSGQVLAADTQLPIPGALLIPERGDCRHCERRWAKADDLGNFTLAGLAPGQRLELRAQAPGFLRETVKFKLPDAATRQLNVTLRREADVWLEFFDPETGAALEHVRVRDTPRHRFDSQGGGPIEELVGNDVHLDVMLEGYAEARITLDPQSLDALEPMLVPLVRLRELRGHVFDLEGAPVVEADVSARDVTAPGAEERWRAAHRAAFDRAPRELHYKVHPRVHAWTGSDGAYWIRNLAPWTTQLEFTVSQSGSLDATGRRTISHGTPSPEHVWVLAPDLVGPAELRGRLTLNGVPTRGTVHWTGTRRSGSGTADPDGRFLLEDVEPGGVLLTAGRTGLDSEELECLGYAPQSWTATVAAGQSVTVELDLSVPMSRIAGHLRDADGEPVPDNHILLFSEEHCALVVAATGAGGAWSVEVPSRPTSWLVKANVYREGEVAVRPGVRPGDTNVELVLERPGMQHLRVIDGRTNRPLTSFEARWNSPGVRSRGSFWELDPGLPDATQGFHFQAPGGLLDLVVSARDLDPNLQPAFALGVTTHRDQPLELVLRPGHRVHLLLGEDQAPWPEDVEVFLLGEHERGALSWEPHSGTVSDGDISAGYSASSSRHVNFHGREAELMGLPPGEYAFVSYPDTVRVHPASVRAGPGAEPVLLRWERR